MRTETAQCIWNENGHFDSFAEFKYTEELNSIQSSNIGNKILKIITNINDLKLEWLINENYFYDRSYSVNDLEWKKISLESSDEKDLNLIKGHININDKISFDLDFNSLPLNRDLTGLLSYNRQSGVYKPITIYIKIIYNNNDINKLSSIISNYKKFLNQKELSDVTFVVEDKEIPAHRVIMAAHSEVFTKMFELDMLEKNSKQVKIEGIEHKTFQFFLNFIYTETLENEDTDELLKLLVAADRYSVGSLIVVAGNYIAKKLTVENVIEVLIIADLVKAGFLKNQCLKLITQKNREVIKTDAYKNMVESGRADLLSELYCLLITKV